MPNHAASDTYIQVTTEVVGAVPILIPAAGSDGAVDTLLGHLDGIILTGSRSNVHPSLYGGPAHDEGTPEDFARDQVTLPLIRAAIRAGLPILAICRGMQELNVALGGTLHQRLQDLPGYLDHSTPMQPDGRIRVGKAHRLDVVAGTWLHRLAGARSVAINSLHNQGVDRLAAGLVVEGTAPDGTIEAVRLATAPGFVIGVQWHPEYDYGKDGVSRGIFSAFGLAVRAHAGAVGVAAD